jgi:hypothetical protein
MRRTWLDVPLALLLGVAPLLPGGDQSPREVVTGAGPHVGARPAPISLLGFGKGYLEVGGPAGAAHDELLAVFENLEKTSVETDLVVLGSGEAFQQTVRTAIGPDWKQIIRVWSKRHGERTVVYAHNDDPSLNLLVEVSKGGNGVLGQARATPETLARWLVNPAPIGGPARADATTGARKEPR